MNKKRDSYGFTIVELLVVIVVIGILASITAVSYTGVQSKAKDAVLSSSVSNMSTAQQIYGISNGTSGKNYQSSSGYDSALGFKPSSSDEVIEVGVNSTGYCIRGYIAGGTKNSLSNALTAESSAGACNQIPSSATSLSGLTISAGALSPTFSSTNLNYTATVPNGTSSITFTPTAQTSSSTIKQNGQVVASGTVGPPMPLSVGTSTVNMAVKSADGLLTNTYVIVVTRNS